MKRLLSTVLVLCLCITLLPNMALEVEAAKELPWPLDTEHEISTGYYYSDGSPHEGVDMRAPQNTPIYANFSGTAQFCQVYTTIGATKYLTSYGNCVYLTSSDGTYWAVFGHLNAFEGYSLQIPSSQTKAQRGSTGKILIGTKTVQEGDLIGYVGTTGNSSGNHLHYGLKINGAFVDPTNHLDQTRCAKDMANNLLFDFWSGEDGETISGKHTFWWKQDGYGTCDVNLDLNGKALGTIYPDENGLFSYTLDTTKYENGTYTLSAIIRDLNGWEKTVTRTIHIDNGSFGFWAGEDGETISATHTFWWKQTKYENCEVDLALNGNALGTIYPDASGLFSYALDTAKYENGTYTISATIRSTNKPEKTVSRTVHIDNGEATFGFWSGEDGETISAKHKFWWKQIGYESSEVDLEINGEALATRYPDENGLISYTLDTTQYENGAYTISATIRSANKPEKTVSRTVHIDNGEMFFGFWAGEDGETISGTYKFWWKQVGYGACNITIDMNGAVLATKTPDENGLFSYALDTTQYENGTYTVGAKILGAGGSEKYVTRTIQIYNMVPDEEITGLKGDVDLNGVVDMNDFVALARHIGEVEFITDAVATANADVTGDGEVNMEDFVKLAQYIGEVIDQL